jgi:hypothetical protein
MIDFSFKTWLNEWADFGLDKLPRGKQLLRIDPEEKPIQHCNLEYVCNQVSRHKLGIKEGTEPFFGEVQWGKGPGAVKVSIGPFGGTHAIVRKQTTNALGETIWVCKKVLEINNYYDQHEDTLTQNILKLAEEVDGQSIEAPVKDFNGLERLVLFMANELRRNTSQRIFIYEGIRKLEPNEHYIIHFGVTGMGVQRQDQKRLDQMQVEVKYDKERGFIKIAMNELGGPIRSHKWELDPSEFIEYYSPAQTKEEITGTVLSLLNSY